MDSNQPPQSTPEEYQQHPEQQIYSEFIPPVILKHSGPGIASFIMGLISLLGYIISVAVAGAILSSYVEDGMINAPEPESILGLGIVGLILIAFIIINVVGVILGIVGAVIKQRKKIFAAIGLIINAVIVLCVGLFFVYAVASAAI